MSASIFAAPSRPARRTAPMVTTIIACTTMIASGLGLAPALAQTLPEGVGHRAVDVWSDGTRLSGDLFFPADMTSESGLPGVVLAHGWGGTRGHLNQAYAPFLAEAGFVALTIDYRGWGDSDSRLVLIGKQPDLDASGEASVRVKAAREIVDPFDQTEDIQHAVRWLRGEPGVDPERIGLWGTSYSGGHAVWVAAHDSKIKATVSQVGAQDSFDNYPQGRDAAHQRAIKRARGEIAPVPSEPPLPGLTGTANFARMVDYSPRDVAHKTRAATLIIDAGEEELFDIAEHGRAVYAIVKNVVPAKYIVIPGAKHYDIYREHRQQALDLAIAWYREHL